MFTGNTLGTMSTIDENRNDPSLLSRLQWHSPPLAFHGGERSSRSLDRPGSTAMYAVLAANGLYGYALQVSGFGCCVTAFSYYEESFYCIEDG